MRAIHSLADYLDKNAQLDIEDDGSGTPDLHETYCVLFPSRLVAEHSWDRVRWAIEECAWRFDQCTRPFRPRRS